MGLRRTFTGPGRVSLQEAVSTEAEGVTDEVFANTVSTKQAAMEALDLEEPFLAFYCDTYLVPLPPKHRFPMLKYAATRANLEQDSSLKGAIGFKCSPVCSTEELFRVHDQGYVERVVSGDVTPNEERALGFPWSIALIRRSLASTGGTVAAMHAVMADHPRRRRAASHIAGGTHHAFSGHGEGFCVFNDIAVAAAAALVDYPEQLDNESPILVIDLDVHQGNGTAKIFDAEPRVVTFSMHGEKNYPWRSKMTSDHDVEMPDDADDELYLRTLGQWLPFLLDKYAPRLVFLQAGVDALKEDSFGRLAMTRDGLLKRNNMVYTECIRRGLPLVICMGGGYSRPYDASVLAHADVYRSAAYRYRVVPFGR